MQEGHHTLARKVFHGKSGQLYQSYPDGNRIGALGLVLDAIVLFNTRYMDAVLPSCTPTASTCGGPRPGSGRSCGTPSA
ncbi:Tn3 family transposase [Nonomuraea sp. NPDC046570]|uniref:Tn3 family transposase n=1 Tax=Nonomuraea sp. NPDC046570 TaxID=3155255 RepID=UPI0033D04B1E